MDVAIRPAREADAEPCGRLCHEAFRAVNERHGFPPLFPTVEVAARRVGGFLRHPSVFGVVAEAAGTGRILGFNFLSERDPIRAVGPIVTDPAAQGHGVGRRLMQAALDRASGAPGVRLLQDGFNMHSLALYASLGFAVREPVVVLAGLPAGAPPPGWEVRPMAEADLAGCEALHRSVHGHPRTGELREALAAGTPVVALRRDNGRVRAYMAAPRFWLANHGVAETEEAMRALLLGAARRAAEEEPLSFLLPVRQAAGLFRWCLDAGFRALRPMTLMSLGEYREPRGSYVPSVLY